MFGLGTGEILLIAVVLVLLFGARKLPQLGEGLGKAIRSFRKATEAGVIDVTPEKEKQPEKLEGHEGPSGAGPQEKAAAEKKV